MGMRKELRNEGRLNCVSTVLELSRGLIASMSISRPVLVLGDASSKKNFHQQTYVARHRSRRGSPGKQRLPPSQYRKDFSDELRQKHRYLLVV